MTEVLPPFPSTRARMWRKARSAWRMFRSFGRAVGWRDAMAFAASRGQACGGVIQIENTNRCNFHCVYCPTHSPDSKVEAPRGDMPLETFRSIIDANPAARVVHIQGQGEPLLDPTFFEKLEHCRARRKFTQAISNGSALTGKNIERLLASPLNALFVSVDVADPAEVEAHRKGMNYARVVENVRELVAQRDRRRANLVVGIISVFYGADEARIERAFREFDSLGIDAMLYKELNASFENRIGGYASERIVDPAAKLRRRAGFWLSHQRGETPQKPCMWLKRGYRYYLNDGRETACCILNEGKYAAPEWGRERLMELWSQRALPGECERCSYFGGYE